MISSALGDLQQERVALWESQLSAQGKKGVADFVENKLHKPYSVPMYHADSLVRQRQAELSDLSIHGIKRKTLKDEVLFIMSQFSLWGLKLGIDILGKPVGHLLVNSEEYAGFALHKKFQSSFQNLVDFVFDFFRIPKEKDEDPEDDFLPDELDEEEEEADDQDPIAIAIKRESRRLKKLPKPQSAQNIIGQAVAEDAKDDIIEKLRRDLEYVRAEIKARRIPGTFTSEIDKIVQIWNYLQNEYFFYVHTQGDSFSGAVDSLDADIEKLIGALPEFFEKGGHTQQQIEEKLAPIKHLMELRQSVFLALNLQSRDLLKGTHGQTDVQKRAEIMLKVHYLLDSYPEQDRDAYEAFVSQIINNASHYATESDPKTVAHFYGPPGVGKNRLVYGLGEALGLHVCKVNQEKSEEERPLTLSQILMGTSSQFADLGNLNAGIKGQALMDRAMGAIASCALKAGSANLIMFFDEFFNSESMTQLEVKNWRDLQGFLKHLFEPVQHAIPIPSLGLAFPVNGITFIFASNYLPPYADGVIDRIHFFEFSALSTSQKAAIYRETVRFGVQKKLQDLSRENNKGEQLEHKLAFFRSLEKLLLQLEADVMLAKELMDSPGARNTKKLVSDLLVYADGLRLDGITIKEGIVKKGLTPEAFFRRLQHFVKSRKT
jgi:cell shape-determining protein MreC